MSDYLLKTEKIIIKKNQVICNGCKQLISNQMLKNNKICTTTINKLDLEQFAGRTQGHTLSHHWLNRILNQYIDLKEMQSNYDSHRNDWKQQIDELQQQVPSSRKYYRMREIDENYDYAAEKERIPQESTKWRNRIQYDLMAECDCHMLTGCDRSKIINIGMICELASEIVFHARLFMYRYHSRRLHGQYFGSSHTNIGNCVKEALFIINERYALPRLINERALIEQYWNWELIHEITPEWCYLIRECVKDDPDCPNLITADGTYQYVKCPETDQDSRKRLWNKYKSTYLVKIHIWSAFNGQPLAATYHYGDGHHA